MLYTYWSLLIKFFNDYLMVNALEHAGQHLLVKLNRKLDFASLEKRVASYHHQDGPGRSVTHPSNRMVRAMLVKYLYGLSLREMEERLYSDMIIRWFVGYSLFDPVPDHSTLERFEQWLNAQHHEDIFDEVLLQIEREYPNEHRLQIGDTYAMVANATRENLVPLIRHLCERLLRTAAEVQPEPMAAVLRGFEWMTLFGLCPEKLECRLDEAERSERLQRVVLGALDLHKRLTNLLIDLPESELPSLRNLLDCLKKVITDEVAICEEVVQRLSPKETGSFRIGSAADLEASYRVHGTAPEDTSFGYNVQVAVSKIGFVCETQAHTGASPDQATVAKVVSAQKDRMGFCPEKLIYDQAAGSGKTRAEVDQASGGQTQLISKLPPYEMRTTLFAPYDFALNEDGKTLTCPNHQSSQIAYRSGAGDGRKFRFFDFQCWQGYLPKGRKAPDPAIALRCPLWDQCGQPDQGPRTMRQVFISDYREQVLAARDYNQTEAFTLLMKLRPQVERVIFELTHYNGARRCRSRGTRNADWQARMCATAYNLKLWVRMSDRRHLAAKA